MSEAYSISDFLTKNGYISLSKTLRDYNSVNNDLLSVTTAIGYNPKRWTSQVWSRDNWLCILAREYLNGRLADECHIAVFNTKTKSWQHLVFPKTLIDRWENGVTIRAETLARLNGVF